MDRGPKTREKLDATRGRLAALPDPLGLLAGLFAHSPVAFQIYSADGRSVLVNDAFRELFGSVPPPEYNVLRDEIAERNGVLGLIHRAFAGETISVPPIWYDARELTQVEIKEGRRVGMKALFFPIHDDEEAVVYVAIAFADVTAEMEKREAIERAGEEARRGEQRMAFLAAVSARLGEATGVEAALSALAQATVPAFADACSILLAAEDGSLRRVAEAAADAGVEQQLKALRQIPVPPPFAGLFAGDEAQLLPDYTRAVEERLGPDHEYTRAIRAVAPRSSMVVPILARGKKVGVITLGQAGASGRAFDAADLSLARELGQRAGMAIENARLFAEAKEARKVAEEGLAHRNSLLALERRRTRQLRGLSQASLDITATGGIEATLHAITGKAREIVGAEEAITSMVIDGSWATWQSAVSRSEEHAGEPVLLPDGSGIEGLVCEINRPIRLTQAELEAHPRRLSALSDAGRRGWLAAPLVSRAGRNMGLIQLSGKTAGEFSATDEDILVQLAQMASVAIENAMLVDELRLQTQRAEDLGRAKDEFLAMLGHELRNPLAPIVTALQILRLRNPEVPREHEVIERQVRHLVRLVDDLLDVSRITRGGVALTKSRVELAPIVARGVELASPILERKRHRLEIDVPAEGLAVDGDDERLVQVAANLISNAAKFTPDGGNIRVSAARHGAEIELRVRDDGIGVAADQMRFIFEPFVQGGGSTLDRSQGGLGLGLTIVRSLVEAHGGRVSAESAGPGSGSEFIVRLPVAAAGQAETAIPAAAAAPQAAPRPGERVLVVDDNVDAGEMLAEALRRAGYEVRVATDGVSAIEAARQSAPTACLLDIGLPIMDGYELARRLREEHGSILLVAVTGYGQAADRERARDAGFDEHVVKPVSLDVVLRLLSGRR